MQSVIPKNYSWPGNFRELEQAVRNIIVHDDEFAPLGQGSEKEFNINQVFANTQVSLNGWSQIYAKKAYENTGSYREAARLLGVDPEDSQEMGTGGKPGFAEVSLLF